jgi:hypothetical protein
MTFSDGSALTQRRLPRAFDVSPTWNTSSLAPFSIKSNDRQSTLSAKAQSSGDAQKVSEGFAIALRAMGVKRVAYE